MLVKPEIASIHTLHTARKNRKMTSTSRKQFVKAICNVHLEAINGHRRWHSGTWTWSWKIEGSFFKQTRTLAPNARGSHDHKMQTNSIASCHMFSPESGNPSFQKECKIKTEKD
jgi:hypothetical protein